MLENDNQFSWPLIGNQRAIDFLTRSLVNKKLSQAYIFSGPADLGKTTIAYCFARNLLLLGDQAPADLSHVDIEKMTLSGDFHVLEREPGKKNLAIDQVRDFIKILELSSFSNSYKVGIIKEAETLSLEAANALLKLLEEPQEKVVIILITNQTEAILETIVSRSQVLNFYPVKTEIIHDYLLEKYQLTAGEAKDLSALSLGRPALAVKFLEDSEFADDYRQRAQIFLDFFKTDLLNRLENVNNLLALGRDEGGVAEIERTLEIWLGLARDLMLINFQSAELIQHSNFRSILKDLSLMINGDQLQNLFTQLRLAQIYLRANVSPKNVLENLAINI